jgi:putative ABC transport system permease protein
LSVRRALGATRGQLAQYLLTESGLLAVAGGVLGMALAVGLIRAAIAFAPPGLPMIATAHIDPSVLAFATGVTLLAVIAFGLAPAIRGANQAPQDVLRGANRSVTGGRVTHIARQALVAAQVALALVVLSGAALLGRTLSALQSTPLGFDPAHLVFFHPDLMVPVQTKSDTAIWNRLNQFMLDLNERTATMPGLGPVTSTLSLPFAENRPLVKYMLEGQTAPSGVTVGVEYALDDYFSVMRIPLLRGRSLARTDDLHAPGVMVVNSAFAQRSWPGQDPIGRRIHFDSDTLHYWWTVVGLVADDRYNDLGSPMPTVYANPRQVTGNAELWYAMRVRGAPSDAEHLLEQTMESTDHAFGLSRVETGPSLLAARLARPSALAALLAALSATALLLAAIGLFGELSSYVRERRREIAVRSALGASPSRLRALVLAQTLTMSVAGVVCGLPLALGGSHLLRTMVSDVRAPDAITIVAIAVVLVAVVAAAAYGPTIRASRVDPRTALAAD